jgi:hypothetical protein
MSQRRAEPGFAVGRRHKAEQFLRAAEEIMDLADDADDIGDAYVTLCVHAGIAGSDTICAQRLGCTPAATTTTRPGSPVTSR